MRYGRSRRALNRLPLRRHPGDKACLALLPVVWGIIFAAVANAQGSYELNLNGLQLTVDPNTGSIVELSYPSTGLILRASPRSAGLLDLAFPLPAFPAMRLASRFSHASVTGEPGRLAIAYQELGLSHADIALPRDKVSAEIIVQAARDRRSVVLACRIENHSTQAIPQVLFPDLWGLKPLAGTNQTQLRLARAVVYPFEIPFHAPETAPPYYERIGWEEYPAGGYYSENALRWLDYGSLEGGLSMFQKRWGTEDKPDVFTYRSQSDPGSLRLAWQHKATIQPGKTWESGEFWLTPHPGGWAKGIEVFRNYVRRVDPPRPLPPHIRDGLGFRTIWMAQMDDPEPRGVFFRFADLPRVAEEARAYGLTELVPWFWCTYFTFPISARPELGSINDLITGIRGAQSIGVNVAPFVSIHIINSRQCAQYGVKPSASDNWTYHTDLIPQFRPYYIKFPDAYGALIDTGDESWQRDVLSALGQWIGRGLSSFSFDQFFAKSGEIGGLLSLTQKVRARARAKDAESTFSGESFDFEHDGAVLDYTWNWLDYSDAGPILNVLRSPRLNCNIEDSPLEVKKCFAEDLYLNVMPSKPDQPNGTAWISEKPALAAALQQVSKLRKEFLPYFVDGVFIGDGVLSMPTSIFVRGYQLGKSLLVIALNTGTVPKPVTAQTDAALWLLPAHSFRLKSFDSTGRLLRTQQASGPRVTMNSRLLQPGELAIFEVSTE